MKNTLGHSLLVILFVVATNSHAAVLYWDPEGAAAATAANLTGVWSTGSQWSTTSAQTASPAPWQSGDAACFCAGSVAVTTPFTVFLNSTMNLAGLYNGPLTPPGFFVTIAGTGSLNLAAGADAFATGGADGGTTTIAVPLTGPGEVALEGSAQIYFNSTNTYTGGTSLGYAGVTAFTGTVNFTNGAAFGSGPILLTASGAGSTMAVEGTLPVTLTNAVAATSINLNITANPAGLTFSGPWTLPATPMIGTGGTTNLLVLSGVLSGAGGFGKYGASTMVLSGANTYAGGTTISNGMLSVTADANLGTPPASATYNIYLSGGILNASNTFALSPNRQILLTANSLLSVSTGNILTDAGIITGPAGWSKTGGGTLVLSGNNSYSGTTTIASGTLEADSPGGSAVGANSVLVLAGGTLSGSGIVSGAVSVTGMIAPGTPSGGASLSLGNGLNLSRGTYAWNLSTNTTSGSFPAISLAGGNLTLGGTSKLALNFTGAASAPTTNNPFWQTQEAWRIISGGGAVANSNATQFATISPAGYAAGNFTSQADPYGNVVLLYQPTFPVFSALSDAGPGFFGGENLILTNFAGLALDLWSTTDASLSVSNWTLVGPMAEQSLNGGQPGFSRYSINVNPTTSPTYYLAGNRNTGPYVVSPVPATVVTTTDFSYFTVVDLAVASSASGVLALLPAPPVILPGSTLASGQFHFLFSAATSLSYVVQASTDLETWSNIGSGTVTNSPMAFTDSAASQMGRQFYRVMLP